MSDAMQFTAEELNRLHQWYKALDDIDPNYMLVADQELVLKILRAYEQAVGEKK